MATTAQLDLPIWRNDDVYEFPLRVIGPDLTGIGMRAQVRLAPDTPGDALAILDPTTNGNAEGIRLVGVTQDDQGRNVNDVRLRINKSTRQAFPYAGELGDAARLVWAFQIAGITRITGAVLVLAHTIDSNNAPASRPMGSSVAAAAMPQAGATLTIASDQAVELVIDGADLLGPLAAQAASDAAEAAATISAVNMTLPVVTGASIAARPTLLSRDPIADDFTGNAFGAVTVTARGLDLSQDCGGFETWIETHAATAATLTFKLSSRTLSGAPNDDAGIAGDVLMKTETRRLDQLADFARDGAQHRIVVDFLSAFDPDDAKLYLVEISMQDLAGAPVAFSFLHGHGVASGEPGYPQANGYYKAVGATAWTAFADGSMLLPGAVGGQRRRVALDPLGHAFSPHCLNSMGTPAAAH